MTEDDLDEEIDELAVEIERTIEETQAFIEGLPAFAPRSQEAKKMERAFDDK